MSAGYRWLLEGAAGAPVTDLADGAFESQAEAEEWFAQTWQDLADAQVSHATLVHADEVVYGPMPLASE